MRSFSLFKFGRFFNNSTIFMVWSGDVRLFYVETCMMPTIHMIIYKCVVHSSTPIQKNMSLNPVLVDVKGVFRDEVDTEKICYKKLWDHYLIFISHFSLFFHLPFVVFRIFMISAPSHVPERKISVRKRRGRMIGFDRWHYFSPVSLLMDSSHVLLEKNSETHRKRSGNNRK